MDREGDLLHMGMGDQVCRCCVDVFVVAIMCIHHRELFSIYGYMSLGIFMVLSLKRWLGQVYTPM